MEYCSCGKPAVLRTSWTTRNHGRCFYGYPDKDQSICQRSADIIPGLLRSKNRAEAKARKLKMCLLVS
ncbi:hypothetical protein QVD17_08192 [Tagetes erecta]|uniref:Uncharacterized protein n=1 Tax=Tagetes erecta TaxID=13708 RepID=A0AAD8L5K3_TARER|nr:hypothetical protein QVD17_08192 [Tagetes erecta]